MIFNLTLLLSLFIEKKLRFALTTSQNTKKEI